MRISPRRFILRAVRLGIAALVLAACTGCDALAAQPTAKPGVAVFDQLSPLASSMEVARRTQTPTTTDRMSRYLDASGKALLEHTIEIASEAFDLHVPARRPTGGYGLLVWIPPADHGHPVPRAWRPELERRGIIYVAPRKAGNSQTLVGRRIPLALHAVHNVMLEFPVDPARVYVGGFSGGARAALRAAVGYPDVFRGGLFNAGSDEIGGAMLTLPPADLVQLLQTRSSLVYVTGARDLPNRRMDGRSRASASRLCIANVHGISMGRAEHAPPDARAFVKAMELLESPASDSASTAACRWGLQQQVDAALSAVEALARAGRLQEAGAQLHALDQRWGGLAAPRSVGLSRRIAAAKAKVQSEAEAVLVLDRAGESP